MGSNPMLMLAAVCMNAAVSSQVSSHLPKVKKQPLMLEAPAEAFIWRPLPAMVEAAGRAAPLISLQPLPPISSMPAVGHGERDPRTPSTAQEDAEAFFMTQVCEAGPLLHGYSGLISLWTDLHFLCD